MRGFHDEGLFHWGQVLSLGHCNHSAVQPYSAVTFSCSIKLKENDCTAIFPHKSRKGAVIFIAAFFCFSVVALLDNSCHSNVIFRQMFQWSFLKKKCFGSMHWVLKQADWNLAGLTKNLSVSLCFITWASYPLNFGFSLCVFLEANRADCLRHNTCSSCPHCCCPLLLWFLSPWTGLDLEIYNCQLLPKYQSHTTVALITWCQ